MTTDAELANKSKYDAASILTARGVCKACHSDLLPKFVGGGQLVVGLRHMNLAPSPSLRDTD